MFDIIHSQTPGAGSAESRKQTPVATGFLDYFPLAIAAVARCSQIGNEQHHPGSPLHWDRSKSGDEADALLRHFMERGKLDSDGVSHAIKVAWRAMAMLQKELEAALSPAPVLVVQPLYSQRPLDARGNIL